MGLWKQVQPDHARRGAVPADDPHQSRRGTGHVQGVRDVWASNDKRKDRREQEYWMLATLLFTIATGVVFGVRKFLKDLETANKEAASCSGTGCKAMGQAQLAVGLLH